MTPKAKEPRSADELEESSCTRRKKSRRVSFAETTIHVFKRDEESESPAESKPGSDEGDTEETVGFRGDSSPGDDITGSAPGEDEQEDGERLRFVRDVDSSSPGSTAGSENSNKDDNFFGPVSRSFINSGEISLSGMSDDNNDDVTLDSTAFSLHFRNIVPPDDRSANSVGSLRTPTGETPSSLPSRFLIKGEKTEDMVNKRSAGQLSNISGDMSTLSPIRRDPNRYDYAKLSPKLQELMDQVDVNMKPTTANSDFRAIISRHNADKVGLVRQSYQDVSDVGTQDSLFDDSDRDIHSSPLPVEYLVLSSDANTESFQNHLNNDKFQGTVTSPAPNYVGELNEANHSHMVIDNAERPMIQSPAHRETKNNLNFQSGIDQKLLRMKASDDQFHTDPASHSVSNDSLSSNAVQQMKYVSLAHTPTNTIKSLHFSPLQKIMSSLQGQKQQQFLNHAVLSSSKYMPFSAKEHVSPLETPDNASKMIQFSSLQGSISTLQAKRRQLLDSSLLSQSKFMNTPAGEQSASLKMEIIKHGERISAIKNHLTASRVKSILYTDHGLASLRKEHLVIDLIGSLDEVNGDPCMRDSVISAAIVDTNNIDSAKESQSMENFRDLGRSGNASNLARLNKNAADIESFRKSQSERNIGQNNTYCNNSSELFHTNDSQISGDLKELTQEGDEVTGSSNLPAGQNLQPATSILVPHMGSVKKLDLKESISRENPVHNEKMGLVVSKSFHVGGLSTNANSNKDSANVPMNINGEEMIGPYETDFGGIYKKETSRKSLEVTEFSAEDVRNPNSKTSGNDGLHSFSKINTLSSKSSQALQSKQETSCSEKNNGSKNDIPEGRPFLIPELVISKISDATNHLLPSSVSNLNLRKLNVLEDLLGQYHTAEKYEGLYTSLRHQNHSRDIDHKRITKARLLLNKLGHAKAQHQLKCVKLQKLRNKAELLKSKTEECNKLYSIYFDLHFPSKSAIEPHELSDSRRQGENSREIELKQELEVLEQKVKVFIRSFESSCNLEGKMSCEEVIKVVDKHLVMRNFCKQFQKGLQLWKWGEVLVKNDQYEVVLDYCNMLFQRFLISKNQGPSIISNKFCNYSNIKKKLPNMNASIAFDTVFKVNVNDKLATPQCIQQETVETNLLMGTLIDVLEEISASRLELWNLISSTFVNQICNLELQVYFSSFKSGRKIILGLDMSSLNCGVYPAEPSELKIRVCETTMLPPIVDEIIAAAQHLEGGCLMILRLCRCVSELVKKYE